MRRLPLLMILVSMLFAREACAGTWYLMAADPHAMSNSKAASMLAKGSVAGPIPFTSSAAFASRHECETSRNKMLVQWRQYNVIQRGGWSRHGFTTPNGFVQCISEADPRLSKLPAGSSAEAPRTMEIMLQARGRRFR